MNPKNKTKLVFGVGINDSDYQVQPTINGKRTKCRFYQTWVNMLQRCYCPKAKAKHPTYVGCSVAQEWLTFSNFKAWMESQDWEGNQLDKDILSPGNKIYGPENCAFVTREINTMLNDRAACRGQSPVGVCFNKETGKFKAQIRKHGRLHHIGYFADTGAASAAYRLEKAKYINEVAITQSGKIKAGLLMHAALIWD